MAGSIPNRPRALPLLACAVLLLAAAASPAPAKVRPGLEVGANVSWLDYDDELPFWDVGWRTSFTGGATLEIPLARWLAISTGLRYVQQGNRVKIDLQSPATVGEFSIYQDYLSVPALLKARSPRGIFVSAGPEIGVLLSGKLITDQTLLYFSPPRDLHEDMDIKNMLESTNLTLDAAIGLDFPIQDHVGTVMVRYTHGLTGSADESQWFSDFKTRGVECLLGFQW